MTPEDALMRFQEERPRFQRAADQAKRLIEGLAKDQHIYANVTARAKEVSSYRAKVAEKGYSDAWSEVTDKAGARAVVFAPGDVDLLVAALAESSSLTVVRTEDKRDVVHPESLGYSGVHVQVVVPAAPGDGDSVECEIQVRTAAQDAWSVVSHNLLYKPVLELPNEAQHAVYRLVALMEIFDQEVERVSEILPTLPGYEYRDLIDAAEAEFLGLAHATSYRPLTAQVLDQISAVVPVEGNYIEVLRAFVSSNTEVIADALESYGPRTAFASDFAYTLFSQSEFLIILERLASQPMALEAQWRAAGLPLKWLKAAANYSEADIGD